MRRTEKRLAVRIMLPEDQHSNHMKNFRRNQEEPDIMISMKK